MYALTHHILSGYKLHPLFSEYFTVRAMLARY